jgi:hypothetical protein
VGSAEREMERGWPATGNGGGASLGEEMAPRWTSAVAGEDGDELSGWSGSDEEQGSDPVWDKSRDRERERCVAHRWGGCGAPGGGGSAMAPARRSSASLGTGDSGERLLRRSAAGELRRGEARCCS